MSLIDKNGMPLGTQLPPHAVAVPAIVGFTPQLYFGSQILSGLLAAVGMAEIPDEISNDQYINGLVRFALDVTDELVKQCRERNSQ